MLRVPCCLTLCCAVLRYLQVFVDRFVRPGCTHFTAEAVLPAAEVERLQQAGAVGLAQEILQRAGWAERGGDGALWAADMLVSGPEILPVITWNLWAAPRIFPTRWTHAGESSWELPSLLGGCWGCCCAQVHVGCAQLAALAAQSIV